MIPHPAPSTATLRVTLLRTTLRLAALSLCALGMAASSEAAPQPSPAVVAPPYILPGTPPPAAPASAPTTAADSAKMLPTPPKPPSNCLSSGDGYLRAQVAGAVEAKIDWPNNGTRCQGESRDKPAGVRLSFQRAAGGAPNLLLVFGVTGVRKGEAASELGVNLTLFVQGTNRIYGTLGDSRCTVDKLTQRPLKEAGAYRIEARGFCTQPAHAVRGKGDVLVSTFEFAGPVNFPADRESL
jgi:hypothetical protein